MKRSLFLSLGLLVWAVSPALAAVAVHDDVRLSVVRSDATGLTGGGPFKLEVWLDSDRSQSADGTNNGASDDTGWVGKHPDPADETPIDTFYSFCVERNEYFSSGQYYDIKSMTTGSLNTGRTLTGYAAWAYQKFYDTIDPLTAAATTLAAYQRAIWAGMVGTDGIVGGGGSGAAGAELKWSSLTAPQLADIAAAGLDYTTDFLSAANKLAWAGDALATEATMLATLNGYKVLNLQNDVGGNAQDQIIVREGPLNIVPEPASLVVWSVLAGGAAGLTAARKRRLSALRGRWSPQARNAIRAIIDEA